jgi:arsenite methyltransferase
VDIGCGLGATVRHLRDKYGFSAIGIDLVTSAPNCIVGDAHCLPFEESSVEGLLFECSLSKMKQINIVLSQAFRVLVPGGKMIVSDFYSLGESAHFPDGICRVGTKADFCKTLEMGGFRVIVFEDHTPHMKTLWGQMILTYGIEAIRRHLGICVKPGHRPRLGYCLVIAEKEERVS